MLLFIWLGWIFDVNQKKKKETEKRKPKELLVEGYLLYPLKTHMVAFIMRLMITKVVYHRDSKEMID